MKSMKTKITAISATIIISIAFILSCQMPAGRDERQPIPVPVQHEENVANEIVIKVSDNVAPGVIDKLIKGFRGKHIGSVNGFSYYVYTLSNPNEIDKQIELINHSGAAIHAEKNYIYRAFVVPNDPLYGTQQYAPQLTGCETTWDTYTGSATTVVAVVDTGINGQHEEITGRVLAGFNCVTNAAIAGGANSDDNGHGSHVAGIIGARGNNAMGIAGLAWQAKLLPVKVLDSTGNGTIADITEGILFAANTANVKVINMSLGGRGYSVSMADAINYAVAAKGITVVVAMGNDGMNAQNYPAAYAGVIAVGSTNGRDTLSSYSTTGNYISVSAPGENICSLSNTSNTGYVYKSGTSMASPFVAGLAALLSGKDPALTPAEIRSIIEDSVVDKGAVGFDSSFGWGRVDVNSALDAATTNNYGTIKVNVTYNTNPLGNVEVLLQNAAGTETIRAALTSDGVTTGGTNGQAVFSFTHAGDYIVKVFYSMATVATQSAGVSLAAETEQTIALNFVGPAFYVIETFHNGGSTVDTYLTLYNNSGVIPLASDDDSGAGTYSKLTYLLTRGSTYCIQVRGYNSSSTGYYSILVNTTGGGSSSNTPATDAGEPDGTAAQASPMAVGTVYDRYLSSSDYDWFVFTVP
jgi:subtilisin family serine protease